MVNKWYQEITLEEVTDTFVSYARHLKLSKQTKNELTGKRSKTSKSRAGVEEFEKYKAEGECFKCAKEGMNVKCKECSDHCKKLPE